RAHRGAELRRAPDPALRDLVLRHALRVGGGVGPRAPLPTVVGNDDIGDVSRPLSMLPAWAALLAQPTPAVPNTPGFAATLRASQGPALSSTPHGFGPRNAQRLRSHRVRVSHQ